MKLISKAAALGAAAAITATGLVGATGTSASATTATTKSVTYSCDLSAIPGQSTENVTAAYTFPAFPTTLPAGTAVKQQNISAAITLSPELSGLIYAGFGGHIKGSVAGKVGFGGQGVDATLVIPDTTITDPTAATTVNATGTLAGFTPATAGPNAVTVPSAVTATFDTSAGSLPVPCTAVAGSDVSLGSVNVTPTLKATVKPKKVKAGHVAKIKVVTTPAQKGKAIAKVGKKKVAKAKLKNGKATLKIKGLKKTTKVKVSVGSLKQVVKVKVKK